MTVALLERSGSAIVRLALSSIANKLSVLLAANKIALLAIERQAAKLAQEKVLVADTVVDKFRTAKLVIKATQISASKLAYEHAAKEFALQSLEVGKAPKLDNAYIKKLNDDLRQSLKDPALSDAEKARRAGLAATSIANRAYTDMQLAVYADVADKYSVVIEKVWVTQDDEKTCPGCLALDGKVVATEKQFAIPAGFKPYQDLLGPPLHLACRCKLSSRIKRV